MQTTVQTTMKPLFALGKVVATPGAIEEIERLNANPVRLLMRHISGDWGDLSAEDKQYNDEALKDGTRILSSYKISDDVKIWIITEWDRSVTTLLLPSEY